MSKSKSRDNFGDSDDLPPPYSAEDSLSSSQGVFSSSHLASLREQLQTGHASQSASRDGRDTRILTLIIPYMEEMLSSITSIYPQPNLVVTTFVPATAVSEDWTPVESNDDVRGEIHRTVRVAMSTNGDKGRKASPWQPSTEEAPTKEFDGWGRWQDGVASATDTGSEAQLWWADEDMARRLAKHLQPENTPASAGTKAIPFQATGSKQSQPSDFRSILNRVTVRAPVPVFSGNEPAASSRQQINGDISLTVIAEEATFRKETDFGLWESMTGWGIVSKVRLGRG